MAKQAIDDVINFNHVLGAGSNIWAVSGKHTESGHPYIANDPHLALTIPSLFYLVEIHTADDFWYQGSSIPGVPLITMGRTNFIAYGITASFADNSDLYEEIVVGDKYLYEGEWYPLKQREEKIMIKSDKGMIEKSVLVNKTHNGPILEGIGNSLYKVSGSNGMNTFDDRTYSLRWTGHYSNDTMFSTFFDVL